MIERYSLTLREVQGRNLEKTEISGFVRRLRLLEVVTQFTAEAAVHDAGRDVVEDVDGYGHIQRASHPDKELKAEREDQNYCGGLPPLNEVGHAERDRAEKSGEPI